MSQLSLREVLEAHRRQLMKIDGVVGVGIGLCEDDPSKKCIVVYITSKDRPAELPDELEGYPVESKKSPGFRAF